MKKKFTIFCVYCLIFIPGVVGADVTGGIEGITLKQSVQFPQPQQTINFTLESFTTNINTAVIGWFVDGKKIEGGTGDIHFSYTVGAIGSSAVIKAVIVTGDGKNFTREVTISPLQVDLVWQALSTTPPFYLGKAYFPRQGRVVISAISNFGNPKSLIYTWKKDGKVLSSVSGYGNSTIVLKDSIITQPLNVEVSVQSESGKESGQGQVTIVPQTSATLFYEDNPLYGILYNSALNGSYNLKSQQFALKAIPYFFSTNSPIQYSWKINNNVSQDGTNNTILLKKPGGVSGKSNVGISAKNTDKILQFYSSNVTLEFNE